VVKDKSVQIVSIKDERLDIDHIDHYRLSFFIGDQTIEIAVKDGKTNRLLLFEQYDYQDGLSTTENLEELHQAHSILAAGFWKEIRIFFKNNQFALVPKPLFDKQKLYEYIRLNERTATATDDYDYKHLDDLGLNFVLGFEKSVKKWFKKNYPKVKMKVYHQGIAYLKAIKQELKSNAQGSLFLDIKGHKALIAGFNFERLAIYNQFRFKDADHLVKLTALTCQQFSPERAETPLTLSGSKEQVEHFGPILKKYFPMLELGKRTIDLQVHPVFNELEPFEYSEILANL